MIRIAARSAGATYRRPVAPPALWHGIAVAGLIEIAVAIAAAVTVVVVQIVAGR